MKIAIQTNAHQQYQQQPFQDACWSTIAIKQCCEPNCDELALTMSNHKREDKITALYTHKRRNNVTTKSRNCYNTVQYLYNATCTPCAIPKPRTACKKRDSKTARCLLQRNICFLRGFKPRTACERRDSQTARCLHTTWILHAIPKTLRIIPTKNRDNNYISLDACHV